MEKEQKANERTFGTEFTAKLQNEQEDDLSVKEEQDIISKKEPISIDTLKVSIFLTILFH